MDAIQKQRANTSDPDRARVARFLEQAIEAANGNACIRRYRLAKEWWSECWTEEAIHRHPPVRAEFEHAIVFAAISEAISMRRSKSNWGDLLSVQPLKTEDILHPFRITYVLKAGSKVRQRWEFRDSFKSLLGKHRGLVNEATRLSKREFLAATDAERARIIFRHLRLALGEFWVACHYGERYGPDGIHRFEDGELRITTLRRRLASAAVGAETRESRDILS